MIEPLRFHSERAPTFAVKHPLYCGMCFSKGRKHEDANVAVKFCTHCEKHYFQCLTCDEETHRFGINKHHIRRTIVLGPGIRKSILTRGDASNFPYLFDNVHIKFSIKVYNNGKVVHREPSKHISFVSGLSGKCIHVQILAAKKLLSADNTGTSDPFIVGMYMGKKLGTTRIRPRTLQPKWKNETFIVPIEDNLPPVRNMPRTQKDLFRLEVYDYDFMTSNDLLGHVELTKERLINLTALSNQKPIRLHLSAQEFHGIVGIQMGLGLDTFHFKIARGEALSKGDTMSASSNPFAKIYFGDELIGITPVLQQSIDPEWTSGNTFAVKINDVLKKERELLKRKLLIDLALNYRANVAASTNRNAPKSMSSSSSSGKHTLKKMKQQVEYDMFGVARGTNSPSSASRRPLSASPRNSNKMENIPETVIEDLSKQYTNLDIESITMFRIEVYHRITTTSIFDTIFSQFTDPELKDEKNSIHLGTTRITVDYLRQMLPNFPTEYFAEGNANPNNVNKPNELSPKVFDSISSNLESFDRILRAPWHSLTRKREVNVLNNTETIPAQVSNHMEAELGHDSIESNIPGPSHSLTMQTGNQSVLKSKLSLDHVAASDEDPLYQEMNQTLLETAESRFLLTPTSRKFQLTASGDTNFEFATKGNEKSLQVSTRGYRPKGTGKTTENTPVTMSSVETPEPTPGNRDSRNKASSLKKSASHQSTRSNSSSTTKIKKQVSLYSPKNLKVKNKVKAYSVFDDSDEEEEDDEFDEFDEYIPKFIPLPPPLEEEPKDNIEDSDAIDHDQNSNALTYEDTQDEEVEGNHHNEDKIDNEDRSNDHEEGASIEQSHSSDMIAIKTEEDGGSDVHTNEEDDDENRSDAHDEEEDDTYDEDLTWNSIYSENQYFSPSTFHDVRMKDMLNNPLLSLSPKRYGHTQIEMYHNEELEDKIIESRDEDGNAEEHDRLLSHRLSSSTKETRNLSPKSRIFADIRKWIVRCISNNQKNPAKSIQEGDSSDTQSVHQETPSQRVRDFKFFFSKTDPSKDEVVSWSNIRHFKVERDAKNVVGKKNASRGYVVVRLIPSNRGQVISGLDEAVRRMSLGETSSVMVRYDYAYGNYCVGAHIPSRSNMIFKVQLLQINSLGRLNLPIRIYQRLRRYFRRIKTYVYTDILYHMQNKPWYNDFLDLLRSLGLLSMSKNQMKTEKVTEDNQPDMDDKSNSDDSSQDSEQSNTIHVDPKAKKFITRGVLAGSKYQWGYNPQSDKRISDSKGNLLLSPSNRKAVGSIKYGIMNENEDDEDDNSDEDTSIHNPSPKDGKFKSSKLPITDEILRTSEEEHQDGRSRTSTFMASLHMPHWMNILTSPRRLSVASNEGSVTHSAAPASHEGHQTEQTANSRFSFLNSIF